MFDHTHPSISPRLLQLAPDKFIVSSSSSVPLSSSSPSFSLSHLLIPVGTSGIIGSWVYGLPLMLGYISEITPPKENDFSLLQQLQLSIALS